MKARLTIIVGIAALAIGILIGRWGEQDSLNGEERVTSSSGSESLAEPAPTPPVPDLTRGRLVPEAAAVYLHLNVPQLAAQRERFRLIDLLRRPEASGVMASFFEKSRPALINAVTECLSYQGTEVDVALMPKDVESGEGDPQLVLAGKVANATEDLDSFLRVGVAPLVAGGEVSTSTEEIMGLPLLKAAGPKGGLFWTHEDGEFLAAREKDLLAGLLSLATRPAATSEESVGTPAWGEDPITFHADLEKAQKSGILPKTPDPNAPILFSALALAAGNGFQSVRMTAGYDGTGFGVALKLTHQNQVPPEWRTMKLGTDVYEGLPAETLAALAISLPGVALPSPPESDEEEEPTGSEADLREATPIQLRLVDRMLPERSKILKPFLGPPSEVAVVGMCPVEAAAGIPGYFLSLPDPGEEVIDAVLAWAKEEGATVESVAFHGLTVYDLDLSDRPIFGAAELARVVMALVGDRLVVATHPELLRKLDPASETKRLGDSEEYSALRESLAPTAAARMYVAAEFMQEILEGHRERLDWSQPGADGTDQLLRAASDFAAPLYISLSADDRSVEMRLHSPSDVAVIIGAGILHRAATAFLIEG